MTLQQISQQVRDLIIQGELDDAANTLVQFLDKEWMSRADKAQVQLYNQALYQLSQLNELKHQVFAGVISNEDADLKRNRIRAVLLEVSEELKQFELRQKLPAVPVKTEEAANSNPAKKRRLLPFILGAAVILALIAILISYFMFRPSPVTLEKEPGVVVQKDTVLVPAKSEPVLPSAEKAPSSTKQKTQKEESKGTTHTTTQPPPPVSKPDLYVRFSVQPSAPISDQPARVTVVVYNSGHEAAKNVEVLWWPTPNASPKKLVFDRIPAGGGDTQSFDYTWYQMQGQVTAKVQVDPQNQIAEENETNNLSSKDLNISKKVRR